eukprot:TRINITY_DN5597_c0_g1_i1.p1 TRINITY_DN5597_c0_g1~~TRINITY_DN5597_c0_g1_i1.p1  ORF type:complete len:220 (-),score=42.83 TRINITY_DN5597_c0_g1_i1:250-909(-)
MLGKSLSSPLLTFESATICSFSSSDHSVTLRDSAFPKLNLRGVTSNTHTNIFRPCSFISLSKTWKLHSTSQTESVPLLEDEERKMWEASRQALLTFKFSEEEADVILKKAFGWVHSPYWGEEREKEVPKAESVNDKLDYLRNLGLTEDDMFKFLKKFPEVLGCSLDDELKISVQILETEWGIKGNSLRNLLLRNPKVLGYNVDCKGDCMAKCTRCWVRF